MIWKNNYRKVVDARIKRLHDILIEGNHGCWTCYRWKYGKPDPRCRRCKLVESIMECYRKGIPAFPKDVPIKYMKNTYKLTNGTYFDLLIWAWKQKGRTIARHKKLYRELLETYK